MKNVLISGAGVAGCSTALWLARFGLRPTVVEIADGPRGGGNAVDFRGPLLLGLLEKMGVLGDIEALQTGAGAMDFIDAQGARITGLPVEFAGGEVEILRSDLCRILYDHTKDTTEYLFNDSITGLTDTDAGVEVTFKSSAPRVFDLVIGADGLHSAVRRLRFGAEEQFVTHHGYYFAGWDLPNHFGLNGTTLIYNEPGRAAGVGVNFNDRTRASAGFYFKAPLLSYNRHDQQQQKQIVAEMFAGMGWRTDELIDTMWRSPNLYLDSIASVTKLEHWSAGRVALVGDAAYGATIGGMGVGTAIAGAYVLAGEIASSPDNHRDAFDRYEHALREFTKECQKAAPTTGQFLAPGTRCGLAVRNWLFQRNRVQKMLLKMAADRADNLTLADYPTRVSATSD